MYRTLVLTAFLFCAAVPQFASAQQKTKSPSPPASKPNEPAKHDHDDHDHDEHAHKGPHDGELLEIGEEEYHAEIVIVEAKNQLDLYLLGSDGETAVSINAPFVPVNLKINGKPTQFKLKPVPQKDDSKGEASCFSLVSSDLVHALHAKNADAKIAIKIGTKSYVLKLEHDHDHESHAKSTSPVKR